MRRSSSELVGHCGTVESSKVTIVDLYLTECMKRKIIGAEMSKLLKVASTGAISEESALPVEPHVSTTKSRRFPFRH